MKVDAVENFPVEINVDEIVLKDDQYDSIGLSRAI
jgi:hypothetical protein